MFVESKGPSVRIWALLGHRAGDNAQVTALARRLFAVLGEDAILEEKPLTYNALRILPNILIAPTLQVLREEARARIAPPWPDLVIGVGRRPVPVARFIQARNPAARIVWLGRPRSPLSWFDLVLTTAQYGLPEDHPRVLMLDLPPAQTPERDEKELARWREKFAHLERPFIGVLVGGGRWPLLFDALGAKRLGAAVNAVRAAAGGSWLVSTSPRTGIRQARALHEALNGKGWFYFWRANDARNNPHRAILALADCFVVSADSASMIAEAVRTDKRVHLFRLRRSPLAPRWRAERGVARWLAVHGLLSPPRDMEAFCTRLVEKGLARWVDERAVAEPACGAVSSGVREAALETAVRRIAKWFSA